MTRHFANDRLWTLSADVADTDLACTPNAGAAFPDVPFDIAHHSGPTGAAPIDEIAQVTDVTDGVFTIVRATEEVRDGTQVAQAWSTGDLIEHTFTAGAVQGLAVADILDLTTAETDTALVLSPDGAGGVAWGTGGSGVASGTSFPGSPSTNDLFFRTDLGLLFFYDGTRWLSTQLFTEPFGGVRKLLNWAASAGGNDLDNALMTLDHDLWIVACYVSAGFSSTNNGSNYWTFTFGTFDTTGGAVTALGNVTTAADVQGNVTRHKLTVGALAGTSAAYIQMEGSWTGTPGPIYVWGMFTYRIVGT